MVLEEIAAGTGVECATKIAGAGEGGEDDRADGGVGGAQCGGDFEAGHAGHLDVGDEDVGGEGVDGVERVASVGGAGDDGDVGFECRGVRRGRRGPWSDLRRGRRGWHRRWRVML